MTLKQGVERVHNQDSLVELLREGLGWPVDPEFAFSEVPEIAAGVKSDSAVTVSQLVPATAEDKHLIVLAEFEKPYVRRDLLELLRSLRSHMRATGKFQGYTGIGDTLFIVAAPDYEDVRFVLFEDRERRKARIRSFGWRREFVGRTVLTHNLERLKWQEDPTARAAAWERAWDVEGLTEQFYKDYESVFRQVLSQVQGAPDDKTRHSWTQLLFNRLLFIAFIQRMGWLESPLPRSGSSLREGVGGGSSAGGYLFDLWARHASLSEPEKEYAKLGKHVHPKTFKDLLDLLFFSSLDSPNGVGGGDALHPLLGVVPYLNGGLFTRDPLLDRSQITVPDEAFAAILAEPEGLFARYNFTVTESTPLDQEVAVDPEMLGKIFERLIIQQERHQSGTYYTPRPIVEFMVNEALKGYLVERGLPPEKAAMLVDEDRVESDELSFKPSELQDALDWLFEVRAVDPACGSGAYLLMLLQRLFELVDRLEVSRDKRRNPSQKHLYETKLRLLQRCVYGVDMNETAVRIARLRLWLSLVVENKGEKPEPLPNFDFLIMQGDSLASPLHGSLFDPHNEIRAYTKEKAKYFHPQAGEARPSRDHMAALRSKIALHYEDQFTNNALRKIATRPFDWTVEFAEVFDAQDSEETVGGRLNLGLEGGARGQGELAARSRRLPGFDIVLANPPYVNSGELLRSVGKAYKEELVKAFPRTATGTADLLVFFMDRAVELLRPGGQFAFITSNKWLKAAYGQKLRGQMAARTHIHHLIDFRDLPVFQGTIAYPLITIATKRHESDKTDSVARFTPVTSLNPPYPDLPTIIQEWGGDLAHGSLGKDGTWRLETGEGADRLAKMRERGIPLGEYVKGRIYRGILTGLNEVKIGDDGKMYGKSVPPGVRVVRKEGVFVIDGAKRAELIAEDPKSAEIIKPLAVGADIFKWYVDQRDCWLVFTRQGLQIDDYPAVKRHLATFREKLEPKPSDWKESSGEWPGRKAGSYKWYEIQDNIAYWQEFNEPHICYGQIMSGPLFAFHPPTNYCNQKCFIIANGELYILGLLNSQVVFSYLRANSPILSGGFIEPRKDLIETIPIPTASDADRAIIESLVQRILDIKSASPEADVSELEAEIDRRVEFLYFGEGDSYEDAVAKDVAEIRSLLRPKIETATLEFKETLWHDVHLGSVHGDRVLDVMKATCAMLNRDGGTILIGVNDNAEIVGINRDLEKLETLDKFQRKLQESFGVKLRPDPSDLVRVRFIPIDGKTIARVDVTADRSTMYTLADKVYLRRDGESVPVDGPDLARWWLRRQREDSDGPIPFELDRSPRLVSGDARDGTFQISPHALDQRTRPEKPPEEAIAYFAPYPERIVGLREASVETAKREGKAITMRRLDPVRSRDGWRKAYQFEGLEEPRASTSTKRNAD